MRRPPLRAFALAGRIAAAGTLAAAGMSVATALAAAAQERTHAVIVAGLGGAPEYQESFHEEASRIYTALVERYGLPPEDVTYLGERVDVDPARISMRSTRANVLQLLGEIAQKAGPADRLLLVLIGHGTVGREEPQLNLPGPDLVPSDLQAGFAAFPTQTVAVVHTGTASGGFITPLSGPNRVLLAATRTERQLNATRFGRFFAEAIAGDGADLDKDGRVSLLEAFQYTQQEVARFYEEENEILTENAVLDDNGDGTASPDANRDGPDGQLAATFRLGAASRTTALATDDPVLARLYEERDEIQGRMDALRATKDSMSEDDYLDALEPLLIELALKNREIRQREGGTP